MWPPIRRNRAACGWVDCAGIARFGSVWSGTVWHGRETNCHRPMHSNVLDTFGTPDSIEWRHTSRQADHTTNFIVGLRGGAYRDRVEQQNLPAFTSPAQHEGRRSIDVGLYIGDDVSLPEQTGHHHIFA